MRPDEGENRVVSQGWVPPPGKYTCTAPLGLTTIEKAPTPVKSVPFQSATVKFRPQRPTSFAGTGASSVTAATPFRSGTLSAAITRRATAHTARLRHSGGDRIVEPKESRPLRAYLSRTGMTK